MKNKEKNELKKAEIRKLALERRKKRMKTWAIVSVLFIAVICFGVYYTISMGGNSDSQDTDTPTPQEPPIQTANEVTIPLSEIITTPVFYTHDADGVEVSYFAIRDSDGEIHAAFNACDICFGAKKGYRQDGDDMLCINCGNKYAIKGLGTKNTVGGCWPSYLPIEVNGENIIIKTSDLEAKSDMF